MMTRVTVLALVSLLLVACGDDDGGTSPIGGGEAGSNGAAGGNGAGSNGGNLGLKTVTCDKSPSKCQIYGESTDEGVASRKTACTEGNGKVVEHCPSEGLAGCCLVGSVGTCTYDATVAPTISAGCTQQGGKWSTSAP